jgi:hypothetical protein
MNEGGIAGALIPTVADVDSWDSQKSVVVVRCALRGFAGGQDGGCVTRMELDVEGLRLAASQSKDADAARRHCHVWTCTDIR